ncbi:Aldo/keto reductase [Dacryopinax primogenitus]|uniref:Aldo/keto reductase n=1 Tax=Dacryopinax primogenitus (strain DJM 731) TaxID=1858805 RepID=M5FN03_DACPD|nr:Aldo/keto reductase [Dacryopinax primogenitus]EJT96595.1 Aldo/keto reductase [Dacryopinax primogenitus]
MVGTSAAVGGHVNMMMDVLIAQLPPEDLRVACRRMLSDHPSLAPVLRDIVHHSRRASLVTLPEIDALFPVSNTVTADLLQYLQDFRLDFLSGLYLRALQRMSWLVNALVTASHHGTHEPSEDLRKVLKRVEGDIVQCIQAIKENYADAEEPPATSLQDAIRELWTNLSAVPELFGLQRARSQVRDAFLLLFPKGDIPGPHPWNVEKWELKVDEIGTTIPTVSLGPIDMPRLSIGLWQLSSPAWGMASAKDIEPSLLDLVSHGFRMADMADHYGDAEIVFGQFRHSLPKELNKQMLTCTKWCVFAAPHGAPTSEWVASKVDERRTRCGGYLDVLQFHWQNYADKRYLEIVRHLIALSRSAPHVVKAIGLVNFDAERTDEICTYLRDVWEKDGMVISNQVQYSLIDQRPRFRMADVCLKHGIKLLTYGTYCGGFLSDKWLGKPSPNLYEDFVTPSLRKYFDMIQLWGGWELFQELLVVLRKIADEHGNGFDIANIAAKWVLEREEVASVIVGTRLGVSSNAESNLRVFSFSLTENDHSAINAVSVKSNVEQLFIQMGDCGSEYRHISH